MSKLKVHLRVWDPVEGAHRPLCGHAKARRFTDVLVLTTCRNCDTLFRRAYEHDFEDTEEAALPESQISPTFWDYLHDLWNSLKSFLKLP